MLRIKPRWISTFHAFCVKVLRDDIATLNTGHDKRFVIYDEDDSLKIIKDVLKRFYIDSKEAAAARNTISKAKQEYQDVVKCIAAMPFPLNNYAEVAREYQNELRKSNALDYDDIIYFTTALLLNHDDIALKWQGRFDFIMVDEFQDTNRIQYSLIKLLLGDRGCVFAVGDPFQTIYTWRGAVPENIIQFAEDFAAKEMKLETNYRSARKVLDAANAVISRTGSRWASRVLKLHPDKEEEGTVKYTENADHFSESLSIVRRIRDLSETFCGYSDIAILIRMSFLSRSLESVFMQHNIPYQIVGGLAFYDRAEVKDMLAYLRLSVSPQDKAAFDRIVNIPSRGLGAKALAAVSGNYKTDWMQAIKDTTLPARQKAGAEHFVQIIGKYAGSAEHAPYSALMGLLDDLDYIEHMKKTYKEDHEEREQNLSELSNVLKTVQLQGGTFSSFLEENLLSSEQDKIADEQSVKILTVHAAKGLEWPVVFVPALEEGIFPAAKSLEHMKALEEERRLFYVACTRAKESLFLSSAKYRMKFGQSSYMARSRYIDDIEEVIDRRGEERIECRDNCEGR